MSPFHYKNPRRLFHGKRIDVLAVDVPHPEGGTTTHELVAHPGAVVILPLLDPKTVLLIRNERYVVGQALWELPAGTLEEGEAPELCAARELEEETGYQAASITPLCSFFTTPGFCNEYLHAYLAQELTFVGQKLDPTEKIEVVPTPVDQALKMIQDQEIIDAKTSLTLLFQFLIPVLKNNVTNPGKSV